MSLFQLLFSLKGRLDRQGFWIGTAICATILLIVANILPFQTLFRSTNTAWLPLVILIGITYCQSAVIIKRLHDRGRSGFALFMLFVPIICYAVSHRTEGTMQVILGTFFPMFVGMLLLLEWGAFASKEANRYGEKGQSVQFRKIRK